MRSTIGILSILGFLNVFCQGQDYLLDDSEDTRYILQQQTSTDPTFPFHQIDNLQRDFYVPSDLQTSDLPTHLQQTLRQYGQHNLKSTPSDTFQNTLLNIPESSGPEEYVQPSTHRPNYSHLHRNLQNSLQVTVNDHLEIPQLANYNFDSEQNEQNVVGSKKNVSSNRIPDQILKHYRHSNALEPQEPSKEISRHNRPETKEQDAADNDPNEEYDEHYAQTNATKESEHESNDKENQNYIEDEEYDEDYLEEDEENNKENTDYDGDQTEDKETTNKTYEILTVKPMVTTPENAYRDFVDTDSMDTTTQELASSDINTQVPIIMPTHMQEKDYVTKITNKPLTTDATVEKIDYPEYVVSVVTSKTIVNNTIISPAEMPQASTSPPTKSDTHKEETSTDSWIVVASVQTSKSISGARYLPSAVVEQHNVNKSLTEPNDSTKDFEDEDEDWSIESTTPEFISVNSKSSTRFKTSTESLIDKLDRVQSDLSSGLLAGGFKNDNIAVIDENAPMKIDTLTDVKPTSSPATSLSPSIITTKLPYPQVNIRKFNAGNRSFRPRPKEVISSIKRKPTSTTAKPSTELDIPKQEDTASIFNIAKPVDDISALLPPGYTPPKPTSTESPLASILAKAKPIEDISDLLPPGFKPSQTTPPAKSIAAVLAKAKPVEDISALLPPGFNPSKPAFSEISVSNDLTTARPVEDISGLLPTGFKERKEESNSKETLNNSKSAPDENNAAKILSKAKPVSDISSLLPPDFKTQKRPTEKSVKNLLAKAKPIDDISSLLPPGYRGSSGPKGYKTSTTAAPPEGKSQSIPDNLLPPGYKVDAVDKSNPSSKDPLLIPTNTSDTNLNASAKPKEVKLVFPSRPGGGSRKTSRLTTARTPENVDMNKPSSPTIQKGWPVRSSTEFTGWPTPPTTPISIEKLLEAARSAMASTTTAAPTTSSSTTTTTKPTTTTPKPTTPGICVDECDLAGTIKLIGGVKWAPELLDRNTKEYQILANDVQDELESIYSSSPILKGWYQKIRIDGFSEGSVLVDYLVELSEIGKKVDTQEIKNLFHESLTEVIRNNSYREGKSLNDSKLEHRVALGQFELDPKFTDFVVIPKHSIPTTGYAEDNILLPQWAIAVIVIGLASLLFVVIFGVTVLVNRHKNSKKNPAPLTEDMLNELNKNHMGGIENYAVDDFYNLEDVWSDKPYEPKSHKKRTNDSIYDNSMSNLYDSWRSQWNGTYDNRYDANINHSQHSGYAPSRRPKYDTDF